MVAVRIATASTSTPLKLISRLKATGCYLQVVCTGVGRQLRQEAAAAADCTEPHNWDLSIQGFIQPQDDGVHRRGAAQVGSRRRKPYKTLQDISP